MAALTVAGCSPAASPLPGRRPPAGWLPAIQLYTLGDLPKKDFEGALREVARIGYRLVELAMPYGQSAQSIREALDRTGLICRSIHVPFDTIRGQEFWHVDSPTLVEDMERIGVNYLVQTVPQTPVRPTDDLGAFMKALAALDADSWKRTADRLNECAMALSGANLRIAYHNHDVEFRPLPSGETGFEILLARTDPAHVHFELDIGWAAAMGQDIPALIRKLGDRARLLHLRDIRGPATGILRAPMTDLGTGILPWPQILAAIEDVGVEYAFVEQEGEFPVSRLESARVAYRFLSESMPLKQP